MISADDIKGLVDGIVEIVVKDKIEVEIELAPDNMQIRLCPWKPYEMKCPYGKE